MSLKRILISVALTGTLAVALIISNAFGFTLSEPRTLPVSRVGEVAADFAQLPPCVAARVQRQLKRVILTDRLQQFFPGTDADSFGFGLMFLDATLKPPLMRIVFFHECGHFYDWASGDPSETIQFHAAVISDFVAMSPLDHIVNDYLEDPQEAFAELFAKHFAGSSYSQERYYRLLDFHATAPLVEGALCK